MSRRKEVMREEVVVITCSHVFSLIYAASITLKVGTSIHKGGGVI